MFESLPSTPYKWHFLAYCLALIGCGATYTGVGPLLPYFSQAYGNQATQYSYIFLARAGGYILGSLLTKIWQRLFTFHQLIFQACLIMAIMLILFSYIPQLQLKTCFIFVMGMMNAQLDIFINMSIIEEEKDNRLDFWLQTSHGAFGIGGLIGPLFVFFFGFESMLAMSVIFILICPVFLFLSSPSALNNQQKSQRLIEQNKNRVQKKQLNMVQIILLCIMFLLFVGQQTAFGGWISSYAVLAGVSSKQFATFYGTLFWLGMTIFRFLFPWLPGSPSKKLLWLIIGGAFTAITSLILIQYVNGQFGVFYSTFLFGIMLSVVFPLLLSTPKQYDINITPSQNSDFMICASLGQGVVAVITGYLMNLFGINMLFYSILGSNIVLFVFLFIVVYYLEKPVDVDRNRKQKSGSTTTSIQLAKDQIKISERL